MKGLGKQPIGRQRVRYFGVFIEQSSKALSAVGSGVIIAS